MCVEPATHRGRSQACEALGQSDEALCLLRECESLAGALRSHSARCLAAQRLAHLLHRRGEPREAEAALRRSLQALQMCRPTPRASGEKSSSLPRRLARQSRLVSRSHISSVVARSLCRVGCASASSPARRANAAASPPPARQHRGAARVHTAAARPPLSLQPSARPFLLRLHLAAPAGAPHPPPRAHAAASVGAFPGRAPQRGQRPAQRCRPRCGDAAGRHGPPPPR